MVATLLAFAVTTFTPVFVPTSDQPVGRADQFLRSDQGAGAGRLGHRDVVGESPPVLLLPAGVQAGRPHAEGLGGTRLDRQAGIDDLLLGTCVRRSCLIFGTDRI